MVRCPVCDELQTDPPQHLPEHEIDLRRVQIDSPVELDLTELDAPGREALQQLLETEQVPHRWDGPLLYVPQDADPMVRRSLTQSATSPSVADILRVLPERPNRGPELAPRTIRLAAGLADWLIIAVFVYVPVFMFWRVDGPASRSELSDGGRWVVTIAPFVYAFLAVGSTGATLGKTMFRIRVRTETGNPPGWRAAAVRAGIPATVSLIGVALPTSPLFDTTAGAWLSSLWFLAVYVPLLFDDRRRGLHDRFARTIVMSRAVGLGATAEDASERFGNGNVSRRGGG